MQTQPKNRRLLFVTHSAQLAGAEHSLLDVAAHFGARVVLLSDGPLRSALEARAIALRVLPMPARVAGVARESSLLAALGAAPPLLGLVARLFQEARAASLVVAHSQKALVAAALATRLARRPLVWYLRDMLTADHFSHSMRRLAVGLANRTACRVLVNSRAVGDAFMASGGRRCLVRVIHNGIDPRPFEQTDPRPVAAVRAALDLGSAPLVGIFGRISPWKGQHVFLEALAKLPGVQAIVVGDPLFGEEAYAARVRDQVLAAGLGQRVRFLGHRCDVASLMAACDVVAHASTAPEPFGRVIVEAMLARRPVVATAAGGVLEIVRDQHDGLLVAPGDADALATALGRLLQDAALRRRIAEAGHRTACARFTLERMLTRLDAEIAAVMEEKGSISCATN